MISNFQMRTVDRRPLEVPIPPWLIDVKSRVEQLDVMEGRPVDQVTVNEYTCGVGLAPHVDTHSAFEGAIHSLSLAGHTVMEFRRGDDHRGLLLPPRSLLVRCPHMVRVLLRIRSAAAS